MRETTNGRKSRINELEGEAEAGGRRQWWEV
jgi:hypothetical protein